MNKTDQELMEYLTPHDISTPPEDTGTYFVVVDKWPNDFNGPCLLIGDYTSHNGKWRIVDYNEGYSFVSGKKVIRWGIYPEQLS